MEHAKHAKPAAPRPRPGGCAAPPTPRGASPAPWPPRPWRPSAWTRSSANRPGQGEQVVHGPVVVDALTVLDGQDLAAAADEEVRGQADVALATAGGTAQARRPGQGPGRGPP